MADPKLSNSYLFQCNGSVKDLTHNDGINRLFTEMSNPFKQIDRNTYSCEGVIAIMDHCFITCTCFRLLSTDKSIDVCMDPKRAIVYFDCGCHRDILEKAHKLYPKHATHSFKQCHKFVNDLLTSALIGWQKVIKRSDATRWQISGTFNESIFMAKKLKCKNCQIILCVYLAQFMRTYFSFLLSEIKPFNFLKEATIFNRIMMIYMVSKLLFYCFSSWHTATYFITDDRFIPFKSKLTIFNFINYALGEIAQFHYGMTPNDRTDAIIFRVTCQAIKDLLKVFMKLYPRLKKTGWFGLIIEVGKGKNLQISRDTKRGSKFCINHFRKQLLKMNAKNHLWTHQYVINKLIERLVIYNEIIQGNDDKVLNGKYRRYLKMRKKDKCMRLEAIECQWKYCKKRNRNKGKFRKCKGCRLCRYCSKTCQKLDWNKGCHKQICALFENKNFHR